jgi:hypothetical protein
VLILGKIGHGYGSEWHLLRYLGRHRKKLDDAIINKTGAGDKIEWLDFRFDRRNKPYDAELKGLDFLTGPEYGGVRAAWKKFWPQSGTAQNWDAVGWLIKGGKRRGLILVEAKGHTGELRSKCQAKGGAKSKIEAALAKVKEHVGAPKDADWLNRYYQYANRLAVLDFLRKEKIKTRLVFVYFYGDKFRDGQTRKGKDDVCPTGKDGWKRALDAQDKHLGLPGNRRLSPYIHKLYLSVTG